MVKERINLWISLLRVKHWIKNGFVFAAIIFSKNLFNYEDWALVILTFFGFSFIASSSYIINDIADKEKDKKHPLKKERPIPSGKVSIKEAIVVAVFSLLLGVFFLYYVNLKTLALGALYFILIVLYSFSLKNIVLIDIITIAAGFDIRAVAGATAINVEISPWLIVSVFLLALFLASMKRRQELLKLKESSSFHKKVLKFYSVELIDQINPILTSTVLISYIIYTLSPRTVSHFGSDMIYTIPFVVYGILRYYFLIYKTENLGDPTSILLKDKPLILNILLWLLFSIYFAYN